MTHCSILGFLKPPRVKNNKQPPNVQKDFLAKNCTSQFANLFTTLKPTYQTYKWGPPTTSHKLANGV